MPFFGRAYYNLLWLEKLRGNSITSHSWEGMDYRALSIKNLFSMAESLSVYFDEETFKLLSDDVDTPEEFTERIGIADEEKKRKCYLIIFEIWRRLVKDKQSISIVCDELDRVVAAYENRRDDEQLLDILITVIEILERNYTEDDSTEEIFSTLSSYIAHDLENVIYTYIDTKLEDDLVGSSADLIDHFMPYVREKRALKFLRLKSLSKEFSEEKEKLTDGLVFALQEEVNIPLSMSVLFYLIDTYNIELFSELFSFLIHHITEEKLLVPLLDVLVTYHRKMGRKEKGEQVHTFLQTCIDSPVKGKLLKRQKTKVLSFLTL